LQHQAHRLESTGHGGIVHRSFGEDRREAGRGKDAIALTQRHGKRFGKAHHHLARRCGTAAFHEAEMALRDAGLKRQAELAHAPALAPFAQQRAGIGGGSVRVHAGKASRLRASFPLPDR
jgi:ribosomal protein L37E